jgi:hypothetical protein
MTRNVTLIAVPSQPLAHRTQMHFFAQAQPDFFYLFGVRICGSIIVVYGLATFE